MNRTAYQPNQHVSYEHSPHRMRYSPNHYPLYSRPSHIPEPRSTTVYGRQNAPDYFPVYSGNRGVERMGSHTLPTHVGQPVWWYEVEVFQDPNPIPIITRDPPPARLPYDYHRYRSTPFVTEVAGDHYGDRQLRHRGDQYFERLMPNDRFIEDNGLYAIPPRPKSVPAFI